MLGPALWVNAQTKIPKKACHLSTGITISYYECGPTDGVPVIMLHGFTDTSRSFTGVAEEIQKRDSCIRIIVPDLRGHGNSSMPASSCANDPGACFTFALLTNDIVSLMDALGIRKAFVVGHSLGGMIAQELALNHTDRVEGVTLIATILSGKTNDVVRNFVVKQMLNNVMRRAAKSNHLRWPEDVYKRTPANLGTHVKSFLRENWVTEPGVSEDLLDEIASETVAIPLGTWIGVSGSLLEFDNRKALEKLSVPALVLYSTGDPVFPPGVTRNDFRNCLQAAARNGNEAIVFKQYGRDRAAKDTSTDLGHNFHWTVPDRVAADITSFVRTSKPEPIHTFLDSNGRVLSVPTSGIALSF